ncbi:2-succinyl-6-hydroxy-2,4-cyclohexadiene-1-carboxylate synthase [Neobacillus terrae]|uniref:2-succinyl-6-hydroxy-2, 4-cyclohexadiene-1-carboxylate synthase n=1 Tax=Neobacillus terrae TaxID=3034837 RepID=UPI00140A29AA|nr:2-succinyl-6-hydroxy-2,4-cyclohexadiene-1-carboxylate synthase [Neobacillus terrae]NHM33151.1 2-succinyl-6-hydroxy-2,4-cyclohexadiene-1-carboxylate synthase [Neobacillus terrae]
MNLLVEGIHYHVEECGSGFPLLALHGFTGNSSTWTPFCNTWGQHSRLIMPDIIGHGETDSPEDYKRYDIHSAASDLNFLFDQLGIESADVLGYSMGGRLALTFAVLYPEKVRKLILESASPGLASSQEREVRCMKDGELANFIIEEGVPAFIERWENTPLFKTMKEIPKRAQEAVREQRLLNSPTGLANSLRGMGTGSQPSWWENLKDISCEVLLLTGSLDQKFCMIAEKMQKELKSARWVTVLESGHAIHVEKSEKFGTIVSEFCRIHNKGGFHFDS